MQRVILANGCQQIDSPVSGTRYYARGGYAFEGKVRGGVFEMSDADAKMAVAMGGAIASLAGTARRSTGWRCPSCGFGSYLKACGRCGGQCVREGGNGAGAAAVADPPAGEEDGEDQEDAGEEEGRGPAEDDGQEAGQQGAGAEVGHRAQAEEGGVAQARDSRGMS